MSSHTSDTNLPQRCLLDVFWRLSPEIRNLVYDHVYDGDITNVDTLTLMRVSKQLHLEAGSHFYAKHTINLSFPLSPTMDATVLPPISDCYLPFLKDIGLEFDVGLSRSPMMQEISATIRKLTTIGANFRRITLLIQFPSGMSHFLQSRLDNSTMKEDHSITAALRHLLDSGVSEVVNVTLNGAWFAPGVATNLKARYGKCLKFVELQTSTGLSEINDLALCERPLTSHSSDDLFSTLDIALDDMDEDVISKVSEDLDIFEPVQDMEIDDSALSIFGQDDFEPGDATKTHGDDDTMDWDSDDDVDMDDLIPFEEGEADAFMDSLKAADDLLINESRTKSEIGVLVNLAPQLLPAPFTN